MTFRQALEYGIKILESENITDAKITIKNRTVTFKNALKIQYSPEFSDIDETSSEYAIDVNKINIEIISKNIFLLFITFFSRF